jgi:hypothetical protein
VIPSLIGSLLIISMSEGVRLVDDTLLWRGYSLVSAR